LTYVLLIFILSVKDENFSALYLNDMTTISFFLEEQAWVGLNATVLLSVVDPNESRSKLFAGAKSKAK